MVSLRLREDQCDLIVIIAKRVRDLAFVENSTTTVDVVGRKFLRRRCDELIQDIWKKYPQAGKDSG